VRKPSEQRGVPSNPSVRQPKRQAGSLMQKSRQVINGLTVISHHPSEPQADPVAEDDAAFPADDSFDGVDDRDMTGNLEFREDVGDIIEQFSDAIAVYRVTSSLFVMNDFIVDTQRNRIKVSASKFADVTIDEVGKLSCRCSQFDIQVNTSTSHEMFILWRRSGICYC
jgi:hypothetical protein